MPYPLAAVRPRISAAGAAAVVPWYLAGGIAASACVAAYQPKGAADLAASYLNLANPGTNNAAPGVAPAFAAATGWTFNGSTQYLSNGIVPQDNYTVIGRYSNATATNARLCGARETQGAGANGWLLAASNSAGTGRVYFNGAALTINAVAAAGVMAFAGKSAYMDGSLDGAIPNGAITTTRSCLIGAYADGGIIAYGGVTIQALAIYNTILSGPQVAAVTLAMQTL